MEKIFMAIIFIFLLSGCISYEEEQEHKKCDIKLNTMSCTELLHCDSLCETNILRSDIVKKCKDQYTELIIARCD